ncbi:MAG: hypothetical protein ACSW77_03345, partial [Bacteroidales bacterium]
ASTSVLSAPTSVLSFIVDNEIRADYQRGYKAIIISTIVDVSVHGEVYPDGYKAIIISTIVNAPIYTRKVVGYKIKIPYLYIWQTFTAKKLGFKMQPEFIK